MNRPKTKAERELERAEAIKRQEQMLSGEGDSRSSLRAADIPEQIERPGPNKIFMGIGVGIIVFLIVALLISIFSEPKGPKRTRPQKPVEQESE